MNHSDFESLAGKVIGNEASQEEILALEEILRKDASLKTEFEEIRSTLEALQTSMPLTKALESQQATLPAYRLQELQSEVRHAFGKSRSLPQSWWTRFSGNVLFRTSFIGAMATALILLISILPLTKTIEIGRLQDWTVRGDPSWNTSDFGEVHFRNFDTEEAFLEWKNQALSSSHEAKIWLDEESNQMMVLERDSKGNLIEKQYSLPKTSDEREQLLLQVLEQIRASRK